MRCLFDFFSSITPDGWISFVGSLLGAVLTLVSILVAIFSERRRHAQKVIERRQVYYDRLLGSLPSIDKICSQADYLNDEDGLLGGFSDSEARIKIMEDRMICKHQVACY